MSLGYFSLSHDFGVPQINKGPGHQCDHNRQRGGLPTFCLARISFSQKLKISVYTLEALGIPVKIFMSHL